ncbi:zinc ribbon domain-containing protein [Salinigranum marinum]|uniref:zinc ribbon domain-containing protein n=1 Tax=Salinigranum marinum TaxID=1515595 RepID=UPI002989AD23|nr:zinc ribbon domain-containing protein [Salinigranum marinum]
MGLRCLLGHDFGPSGVVREHEEDGSEMVVTEREIRRCRRCGEEQVLSESTEVRAIRTEADVGMEPDRRDAEAVAPASSTQGATVGDTESAPDTTALREAAEGVAAPGDDTGGSSPDAAEDAESNTTLIDRAEAGFDEPTDPDEEDAVILDDGDEPTARGHGEWPGGDGGSGPGPAEPAPDARPGETGDETTDTGGSPTDDDPTIDTPDEDAARSVAETAAEEDAELIGGGPDDGETEPDDPATGDDSPDAGGAWPEHDGTDEGFAATGATDGGPGIAYGNEITPQSTNGQSQSRTGTDDGYETSYLDNTVEERTGDGTIVSAGTADASEPAPGVETEYYCPNCGHARPPDSSLRSGDICPECQQGYIAERER